MNDLEKLASEISKMNSIGDKISEITQRPATIGHTGEYIAAEIFDIELEESANAKGIDDHFRSGTLAGRTVNVKWYSKLEYMLDINPDALPDQSIRADLQRRHTALVDRLRIFIQCS